MNDRIPHVTNIGDNKYTMLKDYDHIIASLDITIDNILRASSLISEKNSLSLYNTMTMRDNYEKNINTLVEMKNQYIEDRQLLVNNTKENVITQ